MKAKVKGSLLLHTVKGLKRYREAAEKAVPPTLFPYLERPILPSSWYPEEDHYQLFKTLVQIGPDHNGKSWELYGELTARRDLTDTYDVLLSAGNPGRTLEKLSSLWSLYHDTGRFEVKIENRGLAQLDLTGYALVSAEICSNTGGYVAEMLRVAGATDVALDKRRCRASGDERCRWEARWAEPTA